MTIARALKLDRIGFNVSDLSAATAFYTRALGFVATPAYDADPTLANLFGIRTLRLVRLHRGRQVLELSTCDPPGASYPANRHSNDIWFQHCALATNDIAAAYEQLQQVCFTPISRNGPELLPGRIVAFKFRDPDGHPLELIQFPKPDHRSLRRHRSFRYFDRRSGAQYRLLHQPARSCGASAPSEHRTQPGCVG